MRCALSSSLPRPEPRSSLPRRFPPRKKKTQKKRSDGISGSPSPKALQTNERDHGPLSDPRWPGGRKGQKEAGEAGKNSERASVCSFFSSCWDEARLDREVLVGVAWAKLETEKKQKTLGESDGKL